MEEDEAAVPFDPVIHRRKELPTESHVPTIESKITTACPTIITMIEEAVVAIPVGVTPMATMIEVVTTEMIQEAWTVVHHDEAI